MNILGLNVYHGDSAACLVCDGTLIAAAEEERFRRIKHWAGVPAEATRYCLQEAHLTLGDIDFIAVNYDPRANLGQKALFALKSRPEISFLLGRLSMQVRRSSVAAVLERELSPQRFAGDICHVEHHLAHLASAYLVSPFSEAAVVSIDGVGDFSSAAWGIGQDESICVNRRVIFPHSLGIFYQAMTQFLGFENYGDEYKVMGLAPYGEPRQLQEMRKIVGLSNDGTYRLNLAYFRHHRTRLDYAWTGGAPQVGILYSERLQELLGPPRKKDDKIEQRHFDLARSVQTMYEEAFFNLLNAVARQCPSENLALSGGCAMNSVANGKIRANTPFKNIYIPPAPGDAGGAVGAAMMVWSRKNTQSPEKMDHAYFGPAIDDENLTEIIIACRNELDGAGAAVVRANTQSEVCRTAAAAIAEGKVVGWFQGRMEWGPRALGNRSILGDPRRAAMKDILNSKIKRRESFRPFAPSILREDVLDWFETEDDVPFMSQVLMVREDKRGAIPAITHVDGSGRLQTVHRSTNPVYYELIEAFRDLSGVPIVLNTSFNENEPVVCRPQEAIDCFLRTKMDVLVIERWTITRPQ